MKRILLAFAVSFIGLCANAQRVTFWYGVNYGKESGYYSTGETVGVAHPGPGHSGGSKSTLLGEYGRKARPINFGVDYTSRLSGKFDWAVGLGFNEKGSLYKMDFVQVEANVKYNIFDNGTWRIAEFAGPFGAFKTSDNHKNTEEFKKFMFGVQCGVDVSYKRLSLKVGYEHSLTGIGGDINMREWFARLGVDLFRK